MNNKSKVAIYAENKIHPTKHGHESFKFQPIVIKDGVVHTASNKQLSVEGGR
jgi:hypothetical protein